MRFHLSINFTEIIKSNPLASIILLAVVIRLIVLFPAVLNPERISHNDTSSYVVPAENMLNGHGFSSCETHPYHPDVFRTPVYPIFLATCIFVFGKNLIWVLFIQILIDAFTCFLVFKIVSLLIQKRTGYIAAFLYAVSLAPIEMCSHAVTETVFTFLLVACIYFLLKGNKEKQRTMTLWAGLCWALATLCRPVGLYMLFPILGFLIIHKRLSIRRSLTFLIPGILLVAAWINRNWRISDSLIVSSVSEYNIYATFANRLIAYNIDKPEHIVRDSLVSQINTKIGGSLMGCSDAFHGIKVYKDEGIAIIGKAPFTYSWLHLKSCPQNLFPPINGILETWGVTNGNKNTLAVLNQKGWIAAINHYFGDKKHYIIILGPWIAFHFLIVIGWIGGLAKLISKKDWQLFVLLGGISLYLLIVPGPASVPRFGQPVFPIFLILTCYLYNNLFNKAKSKKKRN